MRKVTQFKHKKVFVLGLAKSGYHAAQLLHQLGASVFLNDGKIPDDLSNVNALEKLGVTVVLGEHNAEWLDKSFDVMVKNPGIPYDNIMVKKAEMLNIPILTDVELAYLISEAPILSITGSNGKTTTTTLLYDMLKENKKGQAYLAGNIGIPSTTVAQKVTKNDVIVMEMSSFQLMGIDTFKPKIATIVNIYNAHIDYHGTRSAYVEAKLNLLKNQDESDYLVLNGDIDESREFAKRTKAQVHYFSKTNETASAYMKDNQLYVFGEVVLNCSDIKVPGEHNLENVLAATLVAKLYGQTNEKIAEAVRQFTGVKHRSQFVKEVNDRRFYNDSKATNILATRMALNGFNEKVILISGGLDRGNEFDELVPALNKVKVMVLYGETKEKMAKVGRSAQVEQIKIVDTLDEAVTVAYQQSQRGDIILFSPSCASWDQFPNFEVRGDRFIALVEHIGEA